MESNHCNETLKMLTSIRDNIAIRKSRVTLRIINSCVLLLWNFKIFQISRLFTHPA